MVGSLYEGVEESQFPTHVVISAVVLSRYVFRSDVAYDWDITLGDIAIDTALQKEDHFNAFAKNTLDTQSIHTTQCPFEKRHTKQKGVSRRVGTGGTENELYRWTAHRFNLYDYCPSMAHQTACECS